MRLVPESSYFNARLVQQKTGLSVQELTPRLAQGMGLGGANGLLVADVEPRSPGATAELKQGMLLTSADGQALTDVVQFAKMLAGRKAGDKTRLELLIQIRRGAVIQLHEAVVLRFGAVGENVVRNDGAVHCVSPAGVDCATLSLEHGEVVGETATAPAVLLGDRAAQQAELACFQPHLPIYVLLRVKPITMWHNSFSEELVSQLTQGVDLLVAPGIGVGSAHPQASNPPPVTMI